MERKNFFEAMRKELDLHEEYKKLESMVCTETVYVNDWYTLNEVLEMKFRNWRHRDNYTSFKELRETLGFDVHVARQQVLTLYRLSTDETSFFQYCEMLINIIDGTIGRNSQGFSDKIQHIIDTINADLAKLNHELIRTRDSKSIIVQIDAAATAATDHVPLEVGKAIIQYNHFLLRGDLDKKRRLLSVIADEIEPKRNDLKQFNKKVEESLFYMFNNMNIRHNNRDDSDKQHFNPMLVKLSNREIENWYDDTYQLSLYAILLIDNVNRIKKIDQLKQH